MADRIPSDHPSVETIRATLARSGGTSRPAVELPEHDAVPAGDVVRLVLDGEAYHARIDRRTAGDGFVVRGAYDAPRFARDPGSAENRLVEWFERSERSFGGSVLLDVVEPAFKFGLREPGERTFYDATEAPDDGLAAIAERLEDG